jgi:hypothetical protein
MKLSTWILVVSALALSVAVQTPDAASAPASPPFFSGDLVEQARVKGGGKCRNVCENRCFGKGPLCSLQCMDKCRSRAR